MHSSVKDSNKNAPALCATLSFNGYSILVVVHFSLFLSLFLCVCVCSIQLMCTKITSQKADYSGWMLFSSYFGPSQEFIWSHLNVVLFHTNTHTHIVFLCNSSEICFCCRCPSFDFRWYCNSIAKVSNTLTLYFLYNF